MMETRFLTIDKNHIITQSIPAKQAAGASHDTYSAVIPRHKNIPLAPQEKVLDFTAYRQAMLEVEEEETQEEELQERPLSWAQQASLLLELISTGGILAMTMVAVACFVF